MIWLKNETDLTDDDYINNTTLICVWALSAHSVLGCKFLYISSEISCVYLHSVQKYLSTFT